MSVRTVVLCGGRGTRALPHTAELPKPLLDVGGRPVLRHVLDVYAGQGHTSFVLAAGFRADLIREFAASLPRTWEVDVVDTGDAAGTATRVSRCRDHVGDRFLATYGDGVGDVDLAALLAFHHAHEAPATLTTVPLPSPYGTVEVRGDGRVVRFREKPILAEHWINAGFFAFDASVFDAWEGDDLEREVLPALGERGLLFAHRHTGFWRSMDTYKDALELSALCAPDGSAPWLRSPVPASS